MKTVAALVSLLLWHHGSAWAVGSINSPDHVILPLKAIPTSVSIDSLVQVDDAYVGDLIAEGLFDIGEGFQINPVLAKSVAWENEGKVFHVTLRQATFSDGSPVTADDVIQTLHRCIGNAEEALSLALQNIDGFEAFSMRKSPVLKGLRKISDHEIEIILTKPSPLLPDALTFSNCYVTKGKSTDLLSGAIGTGPYQLERANGEKIILRKRSDYHEKTLGPDAIEFRATNDWGNYAKLHDWASLMALEGDPGEAPDFNKFAYSQLGTYQLAFNNAKAPFHNEKVRQAIARGLDFEFVAKEFGWTTDRLQAGLFPFGMRGFKRRGLHRELSRAKDLLREAGYSDAKPLKFTITLSHSTMSEKEAAIWPKAFTGLPIAVKVEVLSQDALVARRNTGAFDALRIVKVPGTVDGHRLLTSYLSHSKFNTPRGTTPDCDILIKDSLSIADIDARYKKYADADDCLMAHQVLLPLASLQTGYALLRKPWSIIRQGRYNLRPYRLFQWRRDGT